MLYGILALITAALFAGAAVYINVAEHPARLLLPIEPLLAQWKPSYARGFTMQSSLAVVGAVFAGLAWWQMRDVLWLVGGAVLLANWPYTLLVIMPVNHRLNAIAPGTASDTTTRADLVRWGQLHAVRSTLGIVATALLAWAAIRAFGNVGVP
jgi:hypothetical protein